MADATDDDAQDWGDEDDGAQARLTTRAQPMTSRGAGVRSVTATNSGARLRATGATARTQRATMAISTWNKQAPATRVGWRRVSQEA